MTVIAECLNRVSPGETQHYENLTMFPLVSEVNVEPWYQLLDEALKKGSARVTGVSESGSVPELKFINEGIEPILLLDGEELVGAKQNRILNLTILAPGQRTILIPVSCVEAGRWRQDSTEFASFKRAHYASGRARKSAQVSESLRASESRHSDQADIWADISDKAMRMNAASDTGAAAEMYEKHHTRLNEYIGAFSTLEGQVGAVFMIDGRVVGLDLFDNAITYSKMANTLVESYALDALDTLANNEQPDVAGGLKEFLADASNAEIETFAAIGEGEDLRLRGASITGGALVKDGNVIHLCAFHTNPIADLDDGGPGRLSRASSRRRHWSRNGTYH